MASRTRAQNKWELQKRSTDVCQLEYDGDVGGRTHHRQLSVDEDMKTTYVCTIYWVLHLCLPALGMLAC